MINFDIPVEADRITPDVDTYLHRCGRANHFGYRGIVINIVDDQTEAILKTIQKEIKFQLVELYSIKDIGEELQKPKEYTIKVLKAFVAGK